MSILIQLGIFVLAAGLVLALAWALAPREDAVKKRLADLQQGDAPPPEARSPAREGWLRRFLDRLGAAIADKKSARGGEEKFRAAGLSERGIARFMAAKLTLTFLLPGAFAAIAASLGVLSSPEVLLVTLGMFPLGMFAPNAWVSARASSRRDQMRRSLPDVLDLLVICVEAGMSLNSAFKRVAEKVRPAAPVLADQFLKLHLEIQAGRSREDALRAMGERSGVDEIRSLAAMMVQTDRLGTSIAKALRIHSEGIRTKFHHEAEARAARATVKLAFPLVLCIFPALLVVIVGPAAIRILAALE